MKVDDNHENQEMTTAGKENVKEGQNVEIWWRENDLVASSDKFQSSFINKKGVNALWQDIAYHVVS